MTENDVPKRNKRQPLTLAEVHAAFEPLSDQYPPTLDVKQAAILTGYTEGTLKKKLSEGCFANCVSRGKPLLFWRDRLMLERMNRPWNPPRRRESRIISGDVDPNQSQVDGGGHEVN